MKLIYLNSILLALLLSPIVSFSSGLQLHDFFQHNSFYETAATRLEDESVENKKEILLLADKWLQTRKRFYQVIEQCKDETFLLWGNLFVRISGDFTSALKAAKVCKQGDNGKIQEQIILIKEEIFRITRSQPFQKLSETEENFALRIEITVTGNMLNLTYERYGFFSSFHVFRREYQKLRQEFTEVLAASDISAEQKGKQLRKIRKALKIIRLKSGYLNRHFFKEKFLKEIRARQKDATLKAANDICQPAKGRGKDKDFIARRNSSSRLSLHDRQAAWSFNNSKCPQEHKASLYYQWRLVYSCTADSVSPIDVSVKKARISAHKKHPILANELQLIKDISLRWHRPKVFMHDKVCSTR